MSGRRSGLSDPTALKGIRRALPDVVSAALNRLSDREREAVSLYLFRGATIKDLSLRLEISPHTARGLVHSAIGRLRHPALAQAFVEFIDDDGIPVPASAMLSNLSDLIDTGLRRLSDCDHCGTAIDELTFYSGGPGRPRRYCSPACKQAAYRARRRGRLIHDDHQPEMPDGPTVH